MTRVTPTHTLFRNGHLATMVAGADPYGEIRHGALLATDGRIAWVGADSGVATALAEAGVDGKRGGDVVEVDLRGRWLTPGLIDCHTHLVHGGDRVGEWEARIGGASYEEIARAGGGILSTVRATRAAAAEELFGSAVRRLSSLMREGVTTVEVKSGYGLDLETEVRMLTTARKLGTELPVRVRTTLLAAHALPPEFVDRRGEYVSLVTDVILPAVADGGLADAVDAFCEGIAFSAEECAAVFDAARRHGLPVRLHADQLSDSGGAELAARFGALSADHLEYTGRAGVEAMARAGTVAVLLPGAFYFLGETRMPPVDEFRSAGVAMAVATDLNPGSSPLASPLLALNMACVLLGLRPEEALAGMTRNAAGVLGLGAETGTIERGKAADLCAWEIDRPAELCYWMGGTPSVEVWYGGGRRD